MAFGMKSKEEKERERRKKEAEESITKNNASHEGADKYAQLAVENFHTFGAYSNLITFYDSSTIAWFQDFLVKSNLYTNWSNANYTRYTLTEFTNRDGVQYGHDGSRVSTLSKDEQKHFLTKLISVLNKLIEEISHPSFKLKPEDKSRMVRLIDSCIPALESSDKSIKNLLASYNKVLDIEKDTLNKFDSENNKFNIFNESKRLLSMNKQSKDMPFAADVAHLHLLEDNIDALLKLCRLLKESDAINISAYQRVFDIIILAIKHQHSLAFHSIKLDNNKIKIQPISDVLLNNNIREIDLTADINNEYRDAIAYLKQLIQLTSKLIEKVDTVEILRSDKEADECLTAIFSSEGPLHRAYLESKSKHAYNEISYIENHLADLYSALVANRILDSDIMLRGKSLSDGMFNLMDEIQRGRARGKLTGLIDTVISPAVKHILTLNDALEKSMSSLKPVIGSLDIQSTDQVAEKFTINMALGSLKSMEKHSILEKDIEKEIDTLLTALKTWYSGDEGKNIKNIFREKNERTQSFKDEFYTNIIKLGNEITRFKDLHSRMNTSLSNLLSIASNNSHTSATSLKAPLQTEYTELLALNALSKEIIATLFKLTNDLKNGATAYRDLLKYKVSSN